MAHHRLGQWGWRPEGPFVERILITGAAGQIGKVLRQDLYGSYPLIRVLDVAPPGNRDRLLPLNIEG
jgi:nucleoside-diphosphate-sugar epimerase